MRETNNKGLQGLLQAIRCMQLMKMSVEVIITETNNKCLQGLFDLWTVAHLAQADLEEWIL